MIVVGGTYTEIVAVPDWDYLAGSGMRAAAALADGGGARLHTALDQETLEDGELVASAHRVDLVVTPRSEPVGFSYFTPLSAPSINGPNSELLGPIQASDDTALVFGMIEDGRVAVDCRTAVYDPQRPRDAGPLDTERIRADTLVVVANSAEIRRLGQHADERAAAEALLAGRPAAVVTKRAAAGCTVSWLGASGPVHADIGAHPTARVWPVGSGDVFSAGLAHALDGGADYADAARIGSAAAAHWCSTQVAAVPEAVLRGDSASLPAALPPSRPRVYLAGPFFTVPERWLVEQLKGTLESLGVLVFSPFHDVGPGGLDVAEQDLAGLRDCDSVLALLDGADPGTVFEVGWAVRDGIPVVGYASVLEPEVTKMMAGTTVELHRDLSTACYRAAWAGMGLRPVPGWHP